MGHCATSAYRRTADLGLPCRGESVYYRSAGCISPWPTHRTIFGEGHALRLCTFFIQSRTTTIDITRRRRRRACMLEPTGRNFPLRMPHSSTGSPFGEPLSLLPAIDNQVSCQPNYESSLMSLVKKVSDILIGRPVDGRRERILGLERRIGEPARSGTREIGELLVRQLVEVACSAPW